ncbi:MAG: putative ABC transporter permease, partial [Lactobacillus crispatus]|nr:putative ABC transporter permease [Lactobacillus crispatus]
MPYTISEIIVLFFTYSVIGWLWETFYCSIKDHHYDYRGFLFGPYCPVYGFAVTTILICTKDVRDNLLLLFIVGTIVATIFEFVASWLLETIFHMKL